MRAFDLAAGSPWVIQEKNLRQILDIAQRAHDPDFEAVALKRGDKVGPLVEMRGSVAVINVVGPIFRYANLFTEISGATSVQALASAFGSAVADPNVGAILLNVDSPGGEVSGISELAAAIYEARQRKPVWAYVDDLAASGAYWIASAAERVVLSDTARVGSIGVIATIVEQSDKPGTKTYQFISSVSPNKRPDLESDDGRAAVQEIVDHLGQVFAETVARNRGVGVEIVVSQFGRGFLRTAPKAVAVGMADAIGSFEGVLTELGHNEFRVISLAAASGQQLSSQEVQMNENDKPAAGQVPAMQPDGKTADDQVLVGRKAERERIRAILGCEEAKGRERLAQTIALETDTEPEQAQKLLAAALLESKNTFAEAMARVRNPEVGADADNPDDEAAEVRRILALTGQINKEG